MNQIQKTIEFNEVNSLEVKEDIENISSCPECGGLGGLPIDNPSDPFECCWGCGGSGRIEDFIAREQNLDRIV